MRTNTKTFTALSVLITVGLLLVENLQEWLPQGLQGPASLVGLFLFLWVPFDLIVKIIYKFAGVPNNTKKISPRQSETINHYWAIWLISAPITAAAYTLLFDRSHWKSTIIFGGVFMLLILLSFINRRNKLMGYTKKELFQ